MRAQVAVYNWMKLAAIQAKAALSTGKDAEKGGTGLASPAGPQLTADARSPTAPAPAPDQAAPADYTSFRSKEDIMEEIRRLQVALLSHDSSRVPDTKDN